MFYLVDKPIGPSSNQLLSHLKKYFGVRRAGHSGTLDPLASGLLIVAIGNSTKLLPYVVGSPKVYEFTFDISRTSDSLDLGTPTREVAHDPVRIQSLLCDPTQCAELLTRFIGNISQVPPHYSALIVDGKRSYLTARRSGDTSTLESLPSRDITVYSLEYLGSEFPHIHMRASVSEGTYIRALARDIGQALGGSGVVTELRRTKIWEVSVPSDSTAIELHPDEFTWVVTIDVDILLKHLGKVQLTEVSFDLVHRGIAAPLGCVTITRETCGNIFLGYMAGQISTILKRQWDEFYPIKGNIDFVT